MNLNNCKNFLISLFVFLLLLFSLIIIHAINSDNGMFANEYGNTNNKHEIFRMTGIKSNSSINGQLTSSVSIGEIYLSPRIFGIFHIKPINEIQINKISMDLYYYKNITTEITVILSDILKMNNFNSHNIKRKRSSKHSSLNYGFISRIVFNNLTINIHKDGHLLKIIISDSGTIDTNTNGMSLHKATLNDLESRETIKSQKMDIDYSTNTISLPSDYVILDKNGIRQGNMKIYPLH